MSHGVLLVGYADYVAAIISARTPDLIQWRMKQIMSRMSEWMTSHGLELAITKTKIIMFTRRIIPVIFGDVVVQTNLPVKNRCLMLNYRLTWREHITCKKVVRNVVSLSRLMGKYAAQELVKGDFSCPPSTAQMCGRTQLESRSKNSAVQRSGYLPQPVFLWLTVMVMAGVIVGVYS